MGTETYLEQLLTLPDIYHPVVSRDRKWVAWTWFRMGPAADVFVAPTDASEMPIRLTVTPENTYLVSWVPDNSAVIVSQDQGGNERSQLFQIYLNEPLILHPLTKANPDFFLRGGECHPNKRWLIYGANYDIDKSKEIEPTWIYRHDIISGECRILAQPQKGGYIVPSLSPDGNFILYPRQDLHPAGQQIWLVDIHGHTDRELLNIGVDLKVEASWFPDSKRVLVLAETKTHRKLGILNLTKETLEWILDDPQRNIEHAYVPFGCHDIVVLEVQHAHLKASLVDPDSGKEQSLNSEFGNLIPLAPITDIEWVGMVYNSRQPRDICRFPTSADTIDKVTSLSRIWSVTSLSQDDFAQAEDYHWVSVDGTEIQGYLYQPTTRPKGAIVYVHGGPTYHSQDQINNQIQFFVKNGYVVLDPNYRGSTGFNLEFQESIKKDGWGGLEQEDIRTGIESLIKLGIAMPGKIGITGTSYGGYSTWWAITHFPIDIISAAAPICGMTDLVVDYESTRPDLRPYSEEMMGGRPDEIPQKYFERSPIHFIDNIRGAVLIVQGKRDPNVTPENMRVVKAALDQAGISYEELVFDDEGHGISKPKNQKILYKALLDFFNRTLNSESKKKNVTVY